MRDRPRCTCHAVGAKTKKPDAFSQLAEHLYANTKNPRLKLLSSANMSRRWTTYRRRFTKTLASKRSETGMGLTPSEIKICLSIPGKLDKLCPHFARMEALLAEKHNISAAGTTELGAVATGSPSTSDASSGTDEDEVDDDDEDVDDDQDDVAGDHSDVDAVHAHGNSENEEPEFRFDLASPAPSETGHGDTGANKEVDNEFGLSDDDLIELNSRLLESDENGDLNTHTAEISSSNGETTKSSGATSVAISPRKSSSSVKNSSKKSKKTSSKTSSKKKPKSKKVHKRDLRPSSLIGDPEGAGGNKNGDGRQLPKDTKMYISLTYAENTKQRNDLFKRRLEQEETKEKLNQQRWMEEQRTAKREQESMRRHEILLVLVNQGKSPQEIEDYLRLASLPASNGGARTTSFDRVVQTTNNGVEIDNVGAGADGFRRDDTTYSSFNEGEEHV